MTNEADYYAILEVKPDADEETLRVAYRRLAWRYHPDIAGPEGLERMREINIAYQTLSDPERRKVYDVGAPSTRVDIAARGSRAGTPCARGTADGWAGAAGATIALLRRSIRRLWRRWR